MEWQCDNQNHAEKCDAKADHAEQDSVVQTVTSPPADNKRNDFDCSSRNAKEQRLFCRKAKADDLAKR